MIDLPTSATFAAVMADSRFPTVVAIALLSGLVRGFSGFGAALVYIPLMSAVYGPQVAVPSFVISDMIAGFASLAGSWRKADWREVLPVVAAAVVAAQLGTLVLQYADPVALRWGLSLFVGTAVIVLASGWRYHGKPSIALSVAVGSIAGLFGGAVQLAGPPIIVYWLGGMMPHDVVRVSFFGFFALFSSASVITYALHGLMTALVLTIAVFATPLTLLGTAVGAYLFRFASERMYRLTGYIIATFSALISLPLLDRFLR